MRYCCDDRVRQGGIWVNDDFFKGHVSAGLFIIMTSVFILLFWAHDHREPMVVVVPTCAELDTYGYDGSISCINKDGEIVRPGGN
jgi:hypothetical protein